MYVNVVFPLNVRPDLLHIWNIKHRERNMNPHCTLRKHTHTHTHTHIHMYIVVDCVSYICKWLTLCVTKLTGSVMVFIMCIEGVTSYVFH